MKIRIKPESYINNPAPSLTKGMMDWFYSQLWLGFIRNIDIYKVSKIDSIEVRINQAYKGCFTYHFYVKINNLPEFHMEYWLGSEKYDTYHYFQGEVDKSDYFRYDWFHNFSSIGEIDMGTSKPTERYFARWEEVKRLDKIQKEKEQKQFRFNQYLKLKKEFENDN